MTTLFLAVSLFYILFIFKKRRVSHAFPTSPRIFFFWDYNDFFTRHLIKHSFFFFLWGRKKKKEQAVVDVLALIIT